MASSLFSQVSTALTVTLLIHSPRKSLSLPAKKPFSSPLPYKWSKLPSPAAAVAEEIHPCKDAFAVAKDPSFLANNDKKRALEAVRCDSHVIDEAPVLSSLNGNFTSGCLEHKRLPLSYIYDRMKMALLVGFLTFQGSQQAIADTEFAACSYWRIFTGNIFL